MEVLETGIPGLVLLKPGVFRDDRGYFFESYKKDRYLASGIDSEFIQDNESQSGYGVIRGLHYQLAPYSQSKLVRVVRGSIYDVAVDLRKGSPTFGKWFGTELNETNKMQLFIPRGFAHGFSVLSEEVIFNYKCDNYYSKESERSIHFNDPSLDIDWKIPVDRILVSVKDQKAPLFRDAEYNFNF